MRRIPAAKPFFIESKVFRPGPRLVSSETTVAVAAAPDDAEAGE